MPKQDNFFTSIIKVITFFIAFFLILVWVAKKLWGIRNLWLKYIDPKVLENVRTSVPNDLWKSLPPEVRKELEGRLKSGVYKNLDEELAKHDVVIRDKTYYIKKLEKAPKKSSDSSKGANTVDKKDEALKS
jgi:hypothetical protein